MNEFNFIIGLVFIIVCGIFIGYERQHSAKVIGIRTCLLILLGSYVFTYISKNTGTDHSRVLAQIVSGVSFIGAGIIFKDGLNDIKNLTTAVLVWVLAALGSLIALNYWIESIITTGIIYFILKCKIK